ncbi:MAG: hypothetical protein BM557_04295 [Flavobacterium sp. MedPE-SWcel]|uniref:DUF2805 domain-containing protein n=1 Tax=uncultured Flavobacterium sp. TaxID=165435 RepID=UPI0009238371|nr:DUF2805 domain-containing protein [uncultured Flavobacterium sp.]OIQ21476.1 MAG: hypothetical protein BM557_04295 [Flavobacterium sp. MedPE-SWcel]
MKKNNPATLEKEAIDSVIKLAQEEKKPFDEIKKVFGLSKKEVTEIMRKNIAPDYFEIWKKKVAPKKPKPQKFSPIEDDDVDTKYYINKKF